MKGKTWGFFVFVFWPCGLHRPFCLLRLTCAYLSCKVDEFNVSSTQFVGNLVQESPAGQERVLEQILEYELLLIQQLNFHLVVHNPYRPLEGLLIDLKVVWPGGASRRDFWTSKSLSHLSELLPFFNIIADTVPYAGEPRIIEEERWWLSDSGSHDWCRTAVSPISDRPGSHTQQRPTSRPQFGEVMFGPFEGLRWFRNNKYIWIKFLFFPLSINFILTAAWSYLTECLGLKGDKEMLPKMYDSLRRE